MADVQENRDIAYRIVKDQFFATDADQIDTTLLDGCLDVLIPDRGEARYRNTAEVWAKIAQTAQLHEKENK